MYRVAISDLELSLEACRQSLAAHEQCGMLGDPVEIRRAMEDRKAAIALLTEAEGASSPPAAPEP